MLSIDNMRTAHKETKYGTVVCDFSLKVAIAPEMDMWVSGFKLFADNKTGAMKLLMPQAKKMVGYELDKTTPRYIGADTTPMTKKMRATVLAHAVQAYNKLKAKDPKSDITFETLGVE